MLVYESSHSSIFLTQSLFIHLANIYVESLSIAQHVVCPPTQSNLTRPFKAFLVNFNVPAVLVLQAFGPLLVVNALAAGHSLEHILNARHHTFQATEVDVGALQNRIKENRGLGLRSLAPCINATAGRSTNYQRWSSEAPNGGVFEM